MLERLLLAAIATFCFYLFWQFGGTAPQPKLLGNNLVKTSSFLLRNWVFSR